MEMARFTVEWNFKDISIKDLPLWRKGRDSQKLGLDDSRVSPEKTVIKKVPEKSRRYQSSSRFITHPNIPRIASTAFGAIPLSDIEVICINDASTDNFHGYIATFF